MSVVRYTGDAPGDVLSLTDLGWTTPYARNGLEVHGTEGSLVATNVMRADPVDRSRCRIPRGCGRSSPSTAMPMRPR